MSKHKNKKCVIDDIKFDSLGEAARYQELKLLQRAGEIGNLTVHPSYILAPSVKFAGALRAKPALKYIADFEYWEGGKWIVEDFKSPATAKLAAFQIKRHLMLHIHKIDVKIICKK
jgi:Protein of unknown function (DUF1064)